MIKVINSKQEITEFKPKLLKQYLLDNTQLSEEECKKIAEVIKNQIYKQFDKEITTSILKSLVLSTLIKRGEIKEVKNNTLLGMTVNEFHDLNYKGCKDNANLSYSPSQVEKYTYDAVAKKYALEIMPDRSKQMYIDGFIHHHDLESYANKPNCFNVDLRFLSRNGLKIDGKGDVGAVASPAKSLKVILNHMLQLWMSLSQVFSGGLGYVNFNTLLAPYIRGMKYEDVYQELEGFIYNCNMSLVSKGGQIIFSSIGLDLSIPEVLADKEACLPGGVYDGSKYKDYKREADIIFEIICKIIDKKDSSGSPFRFPNVLFNIRKGDIDEFKGNCKLLHELGANNPTIYYVNCVDEEKTVMGALTSDTPVMTNKGFKYPYELKIGDTVMTYSSDGSKCWNKIYNVIEKTAPSKVFKITCDNNYSFKVTDNHKLPTLDGIVKSENLQVGMELYDYVDELYDPTDDYEAEFIGVFLADGFIRHKPRHQYDDEYIEFHVYKEWKLKEIIKLCEKCNYNYKFIQRKDKSFSIKVYEKELRDKLVKLYDDNLGVKKFPSEYWNDKNKIANIIKGLMFDGRKQSNTSYVWSCSDKELVYDVCYALSYIGLYSGIYVDIRKGKTSNWRTNYRITFGKDKKPKHTRGRKTTTIKSIELVDNTEPVYDLSIENNPNYVCGLGGIHSENCRSANICNYTEDYEKDCMNTGNFMYSTINLPLIQLSTGSDDEFYELLDECCEVVYETLKHRRQTIIDIHKNGIAPILEWRDKDTGLPLYNIDYTSLSIGYCGLNECLLQSNNSLNGEEIIKFINDKKNEFNDRDGLRWAVIGSPAESTAWKFAKINKEKYPEEAIVNGGGDKVYLTNSHHLNVGHNGNIGEHIKNSFIYHPLSGGGCILHIWLADAWSIPEAIHKLNQKIIKGGTQFWAYSKVFTYCRNCGFTINEEMNACYRCKSKDVRKYDRCTGYYLPVDTFNDGKIQEFGDRVRHNLG